MGTAVGSKDGLADQCCRECLYYFSRNHQCDSYIYSNVNRGKRWKAQGEGPSRVEEFGEVAPSAAKRAWARLIKQVYEVDPLICSRCGGTMKVIAVIERLPVIRQIRSAESL